MDIADVMALLFHNFGGAPVPGCLAACDGNGDGDTSGVADAVFFLTYLFQNGTAPAEPFPGCDVSTLESDFSLGCEEPSVACDR